MFECRIVARFGELFSEIKKKKKAKKLSDLFIPLLVSARSSVKSYGNSTPQHAHEGVSEMIARVSIEKWKAFTQRNSKGME